KPREMPLKEIKVAQFHDEEGSARVSRAVFDVPSNTQAKTGKPAGETPTGDSRDSWATQTSSDTNNHVVNQIHSFRSLLSEPDALEKIGTGTLCVLSETDEGKIYGRAITVAERLNADRVLIAKWIRRLTGWSGRQAPLDVWEQKIAP